MRSDDTAWPALTWEPQSWVSSAFSGVGFESGAPAVRYDSAVPPEIAELHPSPSSSAVALADIAARELSRFDAEQGARLHSFGPVLLRSEAASSSQIENLTASARAIFAAELGAKSGRNAELVAANTRAMQAAIDLSERLDATSIREMHSVLMSAQPRHTPGHWREEAVWIGTRSDSPVGAEFVAPRFSRIPALIDDLARFAARADIAPLISVAVAHAQFETLHPFTDGNGRTGRALAQSMLRRRGVTRVVAVPVSAGLLSDVEGYHSSLTAYRDGDVDPIVIAFANASLRAVNNSRRLIADLDGIMASWHDRLHVRRDSNAWRLLDVISRRPVIDAATAAAELGIQRTNAYAPLDALVSAGILVAKSEHRLGPFWRSEEVLAAIDAFAARAGRREAG